MSNTESSAVRAKWARRGLLCLACLSLPAAGQVTDKAYAGLFLFGQFGELCTMCEAIVLCETGDIITQRENVPEDGSFTLYHLQTRTFWSQISTIWEWFIARFDSKSLASQGHTRPVRVYSVNQGEWSLPALIEAHVALHPPVIALGDRAIDRTNRQWLIKANAQVVGQCQRLPLWESLDYIVQNVPAGEQP